MHLKHISFLITAIFFTLFFTACGKGNKANEALPTSVQVTSNTTAEIIGNDIDLTATLLFSDTNTEIITEKVIWKSSDSNVATISGESKATCLTEGATLLTASFDGFTGDLKITCDPIPFIKEFKLSLATNTIKENSTLPIILVATLSNNKVAEGVKFIWKSDDESIVTVNNDGIISGIKYGTTTVSAVIDTTDLAYPVNLDDGFIWPEINVLPITKKVTLALKGYDPDNPPTGDLVLDLDLGESIDLIVLDHKTDGTIEEISHKVRNWEYIKSDIKKSSSRDIQISENSRLTAKIVNTNSITVNVASYLGFSSENSAIVRIEYPLEVYVTHDSGSQILLSWNAKFDSSEYRLKKRVLGTETIEEILILDTSYIDSNFDIKNEIEYAIAYKKPNDSFSDDTTLTEDLNWIKVKPSLNRWVEKNQFPQRAYASSALVGDSIFVFGGEFKDANGDINSTNEVWEYSISSQNWTQRSSMSTPRQNAALCQLDGYIFLFGGFDSNTTPTKINEEISIYRTAEDVWVPPLDPSLISPPILSPPITNASCSSNGSSFYLSGGLTDLFDSTSAISDITQFSVSVEDNIIDINNVATFSLGTARQRHQSIFINDYLYIVGGKNIDNTAISHLEILDLTTSNAISINYSERMPTARYDFTISILNDNIFVFGGLGLNDTPIDSVEFINLNNETDIWNTSDAMPFENAAFISEYDNRTKALYLFGGLSQTSSTPESNQVIYNSSKLTWHPLFNSDSNIYNSASGQIANKFYLIGGKDKTDQGLATNKTQQYNISENAWVSDDFGPGPLNIERNNATTVSIGNLIYVIGGQNKDEQHLKTVEILGLPSTPNNWLLSITELLQPRSNACAAYFNGLIYLFGGTNSQGFVETIEFFNPATQIWTSLAAKLSSPRAKMSCTAIRDTIYLAGGYDDLSSQIATNIVEGFLPKTQAFKRSIMRLNTPRISPAISVFNDRIYVFGGTQDNLVDDAGKKTEIYTVPSNKWEASNSLSLSSFSNVTYSMILSNKIYIFAENQEEIYDKETLIDVTKESTLYIRE